MKGTRDLMIVGAVLLGLWALPCWGQGENPPAAQAGKTSGHGYTAVEQTPQANSGYAQDEIKLLTREYTDALVKRDTTTLERLMSDDYVSLSAASGQTNKKQYIDAVRNGEFQFDTVNVANPLIRVFGGDTVISTGTVYIKGRSKTKGDISGAYQFTRVWVKRNGRWQTVSFQSTPVSSTQSAATPR